MCPRDRGICPERLISAGQCVPWCSHADARHQGDSAMTVREDPVVRTARREAWASLALWLAAMSYSLACCYFFGYRHDPATLRVFWGVPEWVLWGVLAPWTVCTI